SAAQQGGQGAGDHGERRPEGTPMPRAESEPMLHRQASLRDPRTPARVPVERVAKPIRQGQIPILNHPGGSRGSPRFGAPATFLTFVRSGTIRADVSARGGRDMRKIAIAGAGCAALLAGTAMTTTTHASGGLLGLLGGGQTGQSGQHAHRLLSAGGLMPLNPGNLTACANIMHAGGINLIGGGKSNGVGCTNTKYGAGYGTNLITLAPLPATPLIGSCQVFLQNVTTMLPLIGFPFSTGDGIHTSCAGHPSPLDP